MTLAQAGHAGQCATVAILAASLGWALRGRIALWRYRRAQRELLRQNLRDLPQILARIGMPGRPKLVIEPDEHEQYEDRMG